MSSQGDYLDELLRSLEKGEEEQNPADQEDSGVPVGESALDMPMGDADIAALLKEMEDSMELPVPEPERAEFPVPEPEGAEFPVPEPERAEFPVPEPEGTEFPEENGGGMDMSAEDADIAAFLKEVEDASATPGQAPAGEIPESQAADISSMSEDEIERLLAESREMAKDSADIPKEEFPQDVVDMIADTDDSDLKEIQSLLEKSDNNEAVGDEITDLINGGNQGRPDSPNSSANTDQADGSEEALTPKQQKALEKKRLKEEKAAAKKAEREAKKAAKEAKKAARKAERQAKHGGSENAQGADGALDGGAAGGAAEAAGEPIDTAYLDSILSAAGQISGAETISSATGNYDAKVDNIIPNDESDAKNQNMEAGPDSPVDDNLGIDFVDLFGNSSMAENAVTAGGGDSGFPEFVALDGGDVADILNMAGEGEVEKPKKKGFFSRFLEFLTEEEEEEQKENEDINLSEENQEILEDLDKEKSKKGKKGKKGKKKAKKTDSSAENGEEGEEGTEEKKGKKKKEKKPKKEKLPKEEEPVDPRKGLSLRKVLPVLLICLSLGLAIVIITYASVDFTDKKVARDAYYKGDYQTCYQNLYGKSLNESEKIMYGKSKSVLHIRLWIREYEMLEAEGAKLEALDCLIQSVNDYPQLYEYAVQWNATGELAQEYSVILNLLYEKYGLTEDQARAIAAEPDDIEYTKQVNAIVQGGAYGSWNEPEPVEEGPLPDELPEEAELPEGNFIDTNISIQ